jgi:hypothetical protein
VLIAVCDAEQVFDRENAAEDRAIFAVEHALVKPHRAKLRTYPVVAQSLVLLPSKC